MCGISGWVHRDSAKQADAGILKRMNQTLCHRGPDEEGIYTKGNAGLAMRRLAVIDVQGGHQPVSNEDGTVWMVFNGEIYNYAELRESLQKKGHVFRSKSDSETIVHLYEEYGKACVDHLRGMFAFAIWDERQKRLMLARDRFGKKPLYYTEHEGALIFGSELKCILELPGVPRRTNLQALHHYLSLQYVPDPLTAFESIYKLPPAHTLLWEKGAMKIERYWELSYLDKWTKSEDTLADELTERLREAVKIRLVSDVPLGIHLSGGIDSSFITALAAQGASKVKTFSMGFEEESFSELPYSREVAKQYDTEHHEFKLTYQQVPALLEQLCGHFDEPFADPSAVPVYYLSRETRRHVTVALNGDGGDELFAGYPRYSLDGFANLYSQLPKILTGKWIPSFLNLFNQPVNMPGERNWMAGVKRLAQAVSVPEEANMIRWSSYFQEDIKSQLWKLNSSGFKSSVDWMSEIYKTIPATGKLDKKLGTDVLTYLPGDLLVKADRMTMAHSLEGRSPFLDHEFASWAARLPENMKLRGGISKFLLKKAGKRFLPSYILGKGKQGFGIPVGAWFRGPLAAWSREKLLQKNAFINVYFKQEAVLKLFKEHESGRMNHGNKLWTLIMIELWLMKYRPVIS